MQLFSNTDCNKQYISKQFSFGFIFNKITPDRLCLYHPLLQPTGFKEISSCSTNTEL